MNFCHGEKAGLVALVGHEGRWATLAGLVPSAASSKLVDLTPKYPPVYSQGPPGDCGDNPPPTLPRGKCFSLAIPIVHPRPDNTPTPTTTRPDPKHPDTPRQAGLNASIPWPVTLGSWSRRSMLPRLLPCGPQHAHARRLRWREPERDRLRDLHPVTDARLELGEVALELRAVVGGDTRKVSGARLELVVRSELPADDLDSRVEAVADGRSVADPVPSLVQHDLVVVRVRVQRGVAGRIHESVPPVLSENGTDVTRVEELVPARRR
eukprot:scaffold13674_cov61-Phaeocystis_antarctica.AAC.6